MKPKSFTIILNLLWLFLITCCSKITESNVAFININFDFPEESFTSREQIEIVTLRITDDNTFDETYDLEIENNIASGSISLEFGIYNFHVEAGYFDNGSFNLLYFGKLNNYEINESSMSIVINLSAVQTNFEFVSMSEMNIARYGFAYANDGNNLYAIEGATYEPPNFRANNVEIYNSITNNWEIYLEGLLPRVYCNAEYLPSTNKIYVIGGLTYYITNPATYTDTIEVIDLDNGELSYLTDIPVLNGLSGSAVWGNNIYIFGGDNSDGYSNELWCFAPISNTWYQLCDMPEAKETEGEIVDGILYTFGGYYGSVSNRIDSYNIQTNEWAFIDYMPISISAHHTSVYGKYILIIGDYNTLEFVAAFNTETYEFRIVENNMIGRRHCGTEVIGDNLYVYGGNVASGGPALSNLQKADISNYDFFLTK